MKYCRGTFSSSWLAMPENSAESFFCSWGWSARSTSLPFSFRKRLVASAGIEEGCVRVFCCILRLDFVLRIRLLLKILDTLNRGFLMARFRSSVSTRMCVPVGFSLNETRPLTSAVTPSGMEMKTNKLKSFYCNDSFVPKTASKSPAPLAGMMIRTPLEVYLAWISSLGMVNLASNGLLPSLNLKCKQDLVSINSITPF